MGLGNLAENLWWSRNLDAGMLFKMLDRQLWKESRHNPNKMLKELPADIPATAAADADCLRRYDLVLSQFTKYMGQKGCPLLDNSAGSSRRAIAYLSTNPLSRGCPSFAPFHTKLGFTSFGGPDGQIAIMHEEVVEQQRWIGENQFLRALNFCFLRHPAGGGGRGTQPVGLVRALGNPTQRRR